MRKVIKPLLKRFLNRLVFEKLPTKELLAEFRASNYKKIVSTKRFVIPKSSKLELHMLVCERDFLRSFWSLKSFFYYSGLSTKLVIQNDGSLKSEMIDLYHEHFPNCIVNSNNDDEIRNALDGYPMCQFFWGHHAIAKKLFPPLLLSKADYVIVMDSDILWFKKSTAIINCVKKRLPFYVDGGCAGAYVRNQKFMEEELGLYPADNVNSGIVGYQKSKFLDLEFIEIAIQKLVHIPKELILESIGYADDSVDVCAEDITQTLCWWVMEQTIYALLLGREMSQALEHWSNRKLDQILGDLHQFANSPIMRGTALIHYISDAKHNQFFPTGVEHLIKRGFLDKLK